jgi:curved DNA-binding protein CbpA
MNNKETDFYQILGINQDATQEEIKRGYNEQVLLHHPDKGGDPKKFKDVQIAYKILSNETNRKIYTSSLASTFTDLKQEYGNQTQGYIKSDNDFTSGSDEMIRHKREQFMKEFDSSRKPDELIQLNKMRQEAEEKAKTQSFQTVPTYQDLLLDESSNVPTIPCILNEGFNADLFNLIFEKNKEIQNTNIAPYQEVRECSRTDLAVLGDNSVFANSYDSSCQQLDFLTLKTNTHLRKDQVDITKTPGRDLPDVNELFKQRISDLSTQIDPSSSLEKGDTHPLSYHQMGLNN